MKRSTIIVIVIIFISVLVGGLLGFYFYINSKAVKQDTLGTRVETGSNPFGTVSVNTSVTLPGNASTTNPSQTPEISKNQTPETPIPVLRKIFSEPVSGVGFFIKDIYATTSPTVDTIIFANGTSSATSTKTIKPAAGKIIGKESMISFVERATGHIYETSTSSLTITKYSNTTKPKIYEALFISRETVLYRNLFEPSDSIKTVSGSLQTLSATTSEKTLVTKSLPNDIFSVALSPNKNKAFFLQKAQPIGVLANTDGSNAISLFNLPFTEWLISWPNEKFVTITTKASSFVDGYMYTINTATKAIEKVVGNKKGLTTLTSPDMSKVLFSESLGGSTYLSLFDTKTKSSKPLFFRTFAEKCVWSTKNSDSVICAVPKDIAFGTYPDAWYQGLIFFTDDIWRINTKTGETTLLASLGDLSGTAIDVINPTLSEDNRYLIFNNKADLSLWGLQLKEDKVAGGTATTTPNTKR